MTSRKHHNTYIDVADEQGKRRKWEPQQVFRLYLLFAILLFGTLYTRNLSGDVWWHLMLGEWMVEHRSFPHTDPFSYTATNPVVLHEWLAEVISWLVYSRISPSALAALAVVVMSAAFIITFRLALRRSRDALASFVVMALGASASAAGAEMRPQVFSYFFFALAVLILQRYHERGGRVVWALVPLMFVWANFHSLVGMGLGLILLEAVIALLVPPQWAKEAKRPHLAASAPLGAAAVISALLVLINPSGTGVYRYPLEVMSHPSTGGIVEWGSPSFRHWTGISLMALFSIGAAGLALLPHRPAFRDFAYFACFAAVSLVSQRQIVFFATACSAPLALWLSSALRDGFSWLSTRRMDKPARVSAWTVLTLLVAAMLIYRISDARGHNAFDYMNASEMFPRDACDFIISNRIAGPMLNDINYGGYLIYRLWPKHKVFIDTRQGPYINNGVWEEADRALYGGEPRGWQMVLDKYGINFVLLNPGLPLAAVLAEREDWVLVHRDERAVIFVRDVPANSGVIEAYGVR